MAVTQLDFSPADAAQGDFPARHGACPEAWEPLLKPLRPLFRGRDFPNAEMGNKYGHALRRGDAPMDALVEWMQTQGMAKTRPLFMRALDEGIDAVENAPAELCAFFAVIDQQPAWLDEAEMEKGAEVYAMLGGDAFNAARDFILMGGYLSSSINEVLYRAGGLDRGANRRIAETAHWYFNMTEPGAMGRFGEGFKSTIHVRFVHALVRRRITSKPDWDVAADGIAVNQTDMVGTWLGGSIGAFVGALLLGRLTVSYADLKAVMHLFKYSHWLMGVEEDFLTDDPKEAAYRLANLVYVQPGPTEVCLQMAKALAEQPMQVEYQRFQSLRRRWKRHAHLSRNRYFLRKRGMQRLGLPTGVMPWFPALTTPPKAAAYAVQRFLLPGQRKRLAARGRAQQARLLAEVYGSQQRAINPEAVAASGQG